MAVLSGFRMSGNYQANLTCVEHGLPLFAAKQMEVNRQLSFSIPPPGGPIILQCSKISVTCFPGAGTPIELPVTMGALVSPGCLPVAPFAAGVAACGSSASSVALGFPRIFPSETPHVLIGVGSPHGAVMRKKDTTARKVTRLPPTRLGFVAKSSFPQKLHSNK